METKLIIAVLLLPLATSIVVDPANPEWFLNNDGTPFYLCGPGDPEGFLYRGARLPDGTRDGDQMQLINKLAPTGADGIYLMGIRSHGGDGGSTENPFIDSDPANGIDQDILDQWETWFTAMDDNGIIIYFFFYDDAIKVSTSLDWPLQNGELDPGELNYIQTIVNRFEHHENLVWSVMEEVEEMGSDYREHASKIAETIKQYDDYDHPVAVHQLTGLTFRFPDDPYIDSFSIQYASNTIDGNHDAMLTAWNGAAGRYNLNFAEPSTNFGTVDYSRQRNWAIATAGAYVMPIGWDIAGTDVAYLEDCGRLVEFMESTDFNEMSPHDELAYGATEYVLANPGQSYIAYSRNAGNMGIRNLETGIYELKWYDTVDGDWSEQTVNAAGDTSWPRPSNIGQEAALHITRSMTGTTHYIRDGANGDGSDWANALDDLPTNLERGHTYYIADGSYAARDFEDPVSGTERITIKKATGSDHGTDTGWQDSYGDGYALWGPIYFKTSHYTFDGSTGGGTGSWRTGHGFRFDVSSGGFAMTIGDPWGPASSRESDRYGIIIKHVEVSGTQKPCSDVGGGGLKIAGGQLGHHDIQLSYLWLHDLAICMQGALLKDSILENSLLERQASSSSCHSEGWAAWGPSENITVRNNIFSDIEGTAFIAIGNAYDWDVYNNIFMCTEGRPYSCGVGNGVIGTTDHDYETTSDWRVYNNNFVNIQNARIDLNSPNGPAAQRNRVFNNIFLGNSGTGFSGVEEHDYNWFYNNGASDDYANTETHGQIGTGTPFVNWQNLDFRLNGPTQPGIPTEFTTDIIGNVRGADGVWDRGVHEYSGSCVAMTLSELIAEVNNWKAGGGTILQLMQSIQRWKDGC